MPFKLVTVNIIGGPDTINAFHAGAIDVGTTADIPPIEAAFLGIDSRIVAVRQRQDTSVPQYQFGIAPQAPIQTLADLRGKRIAVSPGQAQGSVVYRTLQRYGIPQDQVQIVELPSAAMTYLNALAGGEVDAAPLAGIQIKRYLEQYGRDGAKVLPPYGVQENPINLWVRVETLEDPGKAAAIKLYVAAWARAQRWEETHEAAWIDAYYVKTLGISVDDAQFIEAAVGAAKIPSDWSGVLKDEQNTIDFMAAQTGHQSFSAARIFDRRFESVAGDAYASASQTAARH